MERALFMERFTLCISHWGVALHDPGYVDGADVEWMDSKYPRVRRRDLRSLDDAHFDDLLRSDKGWINATVMTTTDGEQVVELVGGRPIGMHSGWEPSVNGTYVDNPLVIEEDA